MAMKYASRIEAELLSKALAEKRSRETEARTAFKAMQVSIELKKKQSFAASSKKKQM